MVYLQPLQPSQTTIEQRRFCLECGVIHELGGKPLGRFINKLLELETLLRQRGKRLGIHPLTKVERRLVIKKMESLQAFKDPYGISYQHQKTAFKNLISSHRRLPEALLEEILTN